MKKILMFAFIGVVCTLSACAQKLKESQVPAVAKTAFAKQYANTVGQWEKEDGNYEVVFKKDGKDLSSVIDMSGKFILTETELSSKELPQSVQLYLQSHYKNAKVKGAAKIEKASGEVNYEAIVNGKELIFDANGKILKTEKEEKEKKG
jgi:hypothetical protein